MRTSFPNVSTRYPNFRLLTCFVDDCGTHFFIVENTKEYKFGYVQVDFGLDNPFDHEVSSLNHPNFMSAVTALFDYRLFNHSGIIGTAEFRISHMG